MSDPLSLQGAGATAAGIATSLYDIIIIVGIMLIVGVAIFLVWFFLQYKHVVIVRKLAKDRKLIIIDRAKSFQTPEGVKYWKLLKTRKTIPLPPPEAIDLTKRGKFFVEVYKTENDQFYYLQDEGDFDSEDPSFRPITTNQRASLANQIRKKFARRTQTWKDYLPQIASGLVLIMVFAMALIFWEDVTKPSLQFANTNSQIAQKQLETTELLKEIIEQKQILKSENETAPPPPPPPDIK